MKTYQIALMVSGAFVCGAGVSAQMNAAWPWPDSLDAVTAAPKIHKVLFEDDHVRVLEVTIQPGETEPLHAHKYPSVFAYDAAQPKLQNYYEIEKTSTPVDRMYTGEGQLPASRTMGPQQAHRVTITDTFPQHFYRIEFKRMDGAAIMSKTKY
ncbi:MAG: hypothetical protein QM808_03900 [Steroidobacteraceae bacterium]